MSFPVLVFPIDMPAAAPFVHAAQQLGCRVVAASSEPLRPAAYPGCVTAHLPYVTAPGFDAALAALLKEHGIERIFAPHPAVWWHLQALGGRLEGQAYTVCNESPFDMDWQAFGEAYRWAEDSVAARPFLDDPAPALPLTRYAGLFRLYNQIPGQSDNAKLFALAQIARHTAPGDLVEIGSLYGKSAFALAWLAHWHHLGSLVCVDPWELAASSHQGEAARLVNAAVRGLDWQHAFLGFAASLAPFERVAYIRQASEAGAAHYRDVAAAGHIDTPEFGRVPIEGRIAILHIDGNHQFESVRRDLDAWLPFVQPGGWVLFDDYLWAFGDGPKRVGDALLQARTIRTAFVAADTLFVQV